MLDNNLIYIDVFKHIEERVEKVALEEMVKLMVAAQININFHCELIKAQAIIARTQISKLAKVFNGMGCSKYQGCDMCDDHCTKVFDYDYLRKLWGAQYEKKMKKISKAVEETKGLIITVDNKPIEARYHDTCGGSTENSENVMANRVLYLRKVLCDYCNISPNWEGYKHISIKEIEDKLNISFPKLRPTLKSEICGYIDEVKRDEQGRVISLKIAGKEFKGTEIMELLGLNSTRFSFAPDSIIFVTRGKGDGLGLCQYGGNQMALEGHNFFDILNYYFTGIEIKKLEKPCIERPLNGRIIMIDPGHGGNNSQDVTGKHGIKEKEVVLNIGTKLSESLRKLGATVYLTREKDEYVSLSKRAEYANKMRPDFFISLHLNSFSNSAIHGCEIYHYRSDKDSEALAKFIMSNLVKNTSILDRGIRTADFYLLREVSMSSLQIELEYITNPEQELKLADDHYIDKIVESIASGIVEYYRY